MAKTDIEAVILQISADLKQYNRGLKKLEKDTGEAVDKAKSRFGDLDKAVDGLGNRFERIGKELGEVGLSVAKAMGPLAAGVSLMQGVEGAIGLATDALRDFGEIGRKATALGVSTDFLQELRYSASQFAVETERVDDAMLEFGLRVGEMQVKTGSLYGALQSVNPALIDQLNAATSLEQKFMVLADAMKTTTNEQERLVLADAAFSDAGFDLVNVLAQGSAALADQAARAKDLGLIVDGELIGQTRELGVEYGTLASIIDVQLKEAFVSLGPVLVDLLNLVAQVATAISDMVDASRDTKTMSERGLRKKLDNLRAEQAYYDKLPPASEVPFGHLLQYGNALVADANRDRNKADIAEVEAALAARAAERDKAAAPRPLYRPRPGTPASAGAGGAKTAARPQTSDAERQADREAEQLARTMDGLQREIDLIGLSNTEKRVMNALRSAGVEASSAEGRSVAELVRRLEAETAAMAAIEDRQKAIGETAREISDVLVNGFGNAIMGAANFEEALSGVLKGLMQVATQAALFGEGPLAKLLGTSESGGVSGALASILSKGVGQMFGASISPGTAKLIRSGHYAGLFDGGGTIPAGAFGIAGEVGPEIIRGPATVLSRDRTSSLFERLARRSAEPSGAPVYVTITTPDPGAFRQSQGQTTAAIARAVAHGRRSL